MPELRTAQAVADWLKSRVTGELRTNSRDVKQGDGFIAWPGGVTDGRTYIPAALAQGATACVVEQEGLLAFTWKQDEAINPEMIAAVTGLKAASGGIASAYYEHPSHHLDVLAVTGTNGKTSTAWWLSHALQNLGQRCAMVGTLGVGEPHQLQSTGMTTPDPVLLQSRMKRMVDDGVTACAIEASSIGLAEHRLNGTRIRVALFTNFSQDHLDYHRDMSSYWAAKKALFSWDDLACAVVNVDDPKGVELANVLRQRSGFDLWTVGLQSTPDQQHLSAARITYTEQGLSFDVCEQGASIRLHTQFVGNYNISNLLGVLATLRAMGYDLPEAVRACSDLPCVPGRMQVVTQAPLVVVDYAHTPDAVEQAIKALKPVAQSRGGRVTCVLGCGGDRDVAKRPMMAAAAQQQADEVVLTSDNPRSEDPLLILKQMQQGLSSMDQVKVIADRALAIEYAIEVAQEKDVILLAGKGHEDYQEVMGVKHPFSDVLHAQRAVQMRRSHV
jgi:UDP-N-acetylmuramoyl-L-alanyl-D-glutamate--2,6-diaminopimelate ligase